MSIRFAFPEHFLCKNNENHTKLRYIFTILITATKLCKKVCIKHTKTMYNAIEKKTCKQKKNLL